MNTLQDRIRGSLIGGAIGDALGYPVEFKKTFEEIKTALVEKYPNYTFNLNLDIDLSD